MVNKNDLAQRAKAFDKEDLLAGYRSKFHIPHFGKGEEVIYLCGNSLGLQPKRVRFYLEEVMEDWRKYGVEGHFKGAHPWFPYHEFLTEKMAAVVGAKTEEVAVANSLSVNLHLLMASFYRPHKNRVKICMEANAFPSDIYAVKSQLRFHGLNPEENLVYIHPDKNGVLGTPNILKVLEQNKDSISLVLLGGVNFLSGEALEFKTIVEKAHSYHMMIGLDHAHAAGNLALNLHDDGSDFATWCGYKYLNGGPGALSGFFIHSRHLGKADIPRFEGWWGQNKSKRFLMGPDFDPIPTAEAWMLSNPPIFAMAPLMASLEIFHQAGMKNLREKSKKLTMFLEECLRSRINGPLEIITPENRGSQLSLKLKFDKKKTDLKDLPQKLAERGLVADFRHPDILRLSPTALYNTFHDVLNASEILKVVLDEFGVTK